MNVRSVSGWKPYDDSWPCCPGSTAPPVEIEHVQRMDNYCTVWSFTVSQNRSFMQEQVFIASLEQQNAILTVTTILRRTFNSKTLFKQLCWKCLIRKTKTLLTVNKWTPRAMIWDKLKLEENLSYSSHLSETVNQQWTRTIRLLKTAATTASRAAKVEGFSVRGTAQLAPNCQHLSPQKIALNKKATCQTRSFSFLLTSFTFSLPPVLELWRLCHPTGAAMTVWALRLLRMPLAPLTLHSFTAVTSSFSLLLLFLVFLQNSCAPY